jgi:hypothetical protein
VPWLAAARGGRAGRPGPGPVRPGRYPRAAPPDGSIRDYTVLLDLVLLQGATVVASPAEGLPDAARAHGGTAAIVHPGTSLPAGLDLRMVTAAN